ncbi:MAG: prepilin-type N-terminal cleavage/methylation domain-containing protein, partial [Aquificota bacterium]
MPIGFIKSKKAYTLVEILVATFLFLIIGSIITWLLIKGLKVVGQVGGETTSSIRTSINLDVLHFDIIHAGYGISNNEKIVLSYCNGTLLSDNPACSVATELNAADNKLLLLRETSNVFDLYSPSDPKDSVGFAVWNGT